MVHRIDAGPRPLGLCRLKQHETVAIDGRIVVEKGTLAK